MKISKISVRRLQIPLRLRFEQSNSRAAYSDSTIVEINTGNNLIGYGESCPRPYVTGEDFVTVSRDIHDVADLLKQTAFKSIEDIRECVTVVLPRHMGPAAVCAVELALLDAWSKETGTPMAAALGATLPARVQYAGVVPLRSPEGAAQLMALMRHFAFKDLKLKIDANLDANLARIDAVRAVFPAHIPLRVDVNCAWSWDDAIRHIPALLKKGIWVIEQPFPTGQDADAARLQRHFGDDICLMADESLTTPATARHLLQQQACRRFNLKVSKHGGIFNTLSIYRMARAQGITCQLGAHFGETSILTAAGITLAAMAGPLTAMEGGLGTHLLEYDLVQPPLQIDAQAAIVLGSEWVGWGATT
ncbi:MAG: hypothetical protein H6565_06065 [Lewinellaceae bacterium]|nr:hypothetical protein [Lewinellaceae bacterium]